MAKVITYRVPATLTEEKSLKLDEENQKVENEENLDSLTSVELTKLTIEIGRENSGSLETLKGMIEPGQEGFVYIKKIIG